LIDRCHWLDVLYKNLQNYTAIKCSISLFKQCNSYNINVRFSFINMYIGVLLRRNLWQTKLIYGNFTLQQQLSDTFNYYLMHTFITYNQITEEKSYEWLKRTAHNRRMVAIGRRNCLTAEHLKEKKSNCMRYKNT